MGRCAARQRGGRCTSGLQAAREGVRSHPPGLPHPRRSPIVRQRAVWPSRSRRSRLQRGPGPPPCLAGPRPSTPLTAMPTPGRRHPASSPAAAGPPWCAGGPDANPCQPLETCGVGGGGRRGVGRPPGVLPGTTIEPCPRCPQAGHPQLPPQALESSLAAWQPDAKRRRVGEVSGGKGRLGLDPPPAALP